MSMKQDVGIRQDVWNLGFGESCRSVDPFVKLVHGWRN